jgi:hypothetical protein
MPNIWNFKISGFRHFFPIPSSGRSKGLNCRIQSPWWARVPPILLALFKVTSNLFYLVFYFLINRKPELREMEKDVTSVRLSLFIHTLLSSNPKNTNWARSGKQCTWWTITPVKYFSASMKHINETYMTSRKRIFRGSPCLGNSFCDFGRSVMPLGRGRKNDFSMRRLTLKRNDLPSDHLKLHICRGRKILNLRVYISLLYPFLFLVNTKHDFGAAVKDSFQVIDVSAYITCAFNMTKYDLLEVY